MKTINESAVAVSGAALQVELTPGIGTPVVALACPVEALTSAAPVYMTNLRGYSASK